MAPFSEELLGTVLSKDLKWRVTLSHGFIYIWTDAEQSKRPRYILSAEMPPEVLLLAARAARRYSGSEQDGYALSPITEKSVREAIDEGEMG
jgi:hypothetical protein